MLFLKDVIQNLTIITDGKIPKIVSRVPIFKKKMTQAIKKGAQKSKVFIADRAIVVDWGEEPSIAANEILEMYPKKHYIDLLVIL